MEHRVISRYEGLLAEIYDVEQNWTEDIGAYLGMAAKFGDPILELGTGTGRLLLPLAERGYEVTGIDSSSEMLDILARKIESLPRAVRRRITVVNADMQDFWLRRTYAFAFMAYNTLNHLNGKSEVLATLRCVREHLRPQGVFVLDNYTPNVRMMKESHGKTVVYEHYHPDRDSVVVVYFTPHYDFDHNRENDVIVVEEFQDERLVRRDICEEGLSFYFPRDVRSYIEEAGFRVDGAYGSLLGEPLSSDSLEMVFVCRPKA